MNNSLLSTTTRHLNITTSKRFVMGKQDELFPYALDFALKIVYSLLATVSLLSNSGIVYIFMKKKIKMNSFKVLLLNLTICDALSAASIWPYIFIDLKCLRGMANTKFMCAITIGNVLYWFASVASIFSLTLMSINRYFAICHPQAAKQFSKRRAVMIVFFLIWPTSIVISAPNIVAFKYLPKYAICTRDWPKGFNGTVFGILTFLLGLILPVCVITFTFIATRKYLWSRRFGSARRSAQTIRRNRKASIFMALLIVAFFVCWSPFFVYWILSKVTPSVFPKGIHGDYTTTRAVRIVVLISLFNTVINPIIYGLRGDIEFKNSFRKLKQFLCCQTLFAIKSNVEKVERDTRQTSSV